MIQKLAYKRYSLFDRVDRKIYIRNYPDLKPVGELNVDMSPRHDRTETRIWPNVIPLPEGYPAPYIAPKFDRAKFPGMSQPNWTYGALYLYHGYPTQESREPVWRGLLASLFFIIPTQGEEREKFSIFFGQDCGKLKLANSRNGSEGSIGSLPSLMS